MIKILFYVLYDAKMNFYVALSGGSEANCINNVLIGDFRESEEREVKIKRREVKIRWMKPCGARADDRRGGRKIIEKL